MEKKWENIIIHCSASDWGSEREIQEWHKQRGWRTTGYHFVVNNGQILPDLFLNAMNGAIEAGREIDGDGIAAEDEAGAHAYGMNRTSIGICLIGRKIFTYEQIEATARLVSDLRVKFDIGVDNVLGHYEVSSSKTCPNIDMDRFRLKFLF